MYIDQFIRRLTQTWMIASFALLSASEKFFDHKYVLETPYRNQLNCDFYNSAAIPVGDGIMVLHRGDGLRFGRDENMLYPTLNRWDGGLVSRCTHDDFRPPHREPIIGTTEDPRLFLHNGSMFALYTSTATGKRSDPRFFCLAELSVDPDQNHVAVKRITRLEYARAKRIEKNWVLLSHEKDLYLIYSLFPARILKVDLDAIQQGQHESALFDAYLSGREFLPGGVKVFSNSTNFVPVTLNGEHYYLCVYHFFRQSPPRLFPAPSDRQGVFRHYFAGFLLLKAEPPFKVTHCSPPILDEHFDFKGKDRVVFPTSCWIKDDQFYVSMGVQDRETWLLSAPMDRVLQRCAEWPLMGNVPMWQWGTTWPGSRWPVETPALPKTNPGPPDPDSMVWMDPS
ncbi:MAG: hypothetical protein ACOYKZ_06545 [Chlamydiia bacterium]